MPHLPAVAHRRGRISSTTTPLGTHMSEPAATSRRRWLLAASVALIALGWLASRPATPSAPSVAERSTAPPPDARRNEPSVERTAPAPAAPTDPAAAPAAASAGWGVYGCAHPDLVGVAYRYQAIDAEGVGITVEQQGTKAGLMLLKEVPSGQVPIAIEGYREAVLSWSIGDDGQVDCSLTELEPADPTSITVTGLEALPEGDLTVSLCGPAQPVSSDGAFAFDAPPSDCVEAHIDYRMGPVRARMKVPIETLEALDGPLDFAPVRATIELPRNGSAGTIGVPVTLTEEGASVMGIEQVSEAAPDLAEGPMLRSVGDLSLVDADTATFLHAMVELADGAPFASAE